MRPPVLSASNDASGDDTAEHLRPPDADTLALRADELSPGDDATDAPIDAPIHDETAPVPEATARFDVESTTNG